MAKERTKRLDWEKIQKVAENKIADKQNEAQRRLEQTEAAPDEPLFGFGRSGHNKSDTVSIKKARQVTDKAQEKISSMNQWANTLKQEGFEAVVIPAGLWDELCNAFDLFQFEHLSGDGTTHTEPDGETIKRYKEQYKSYKKAADIPAFISLHPLMLTALVVISFVVGFGGLYTFGLLGYAKQPAVSIAQQIGFATFITGLITPLAINVYAKYRVNNFNPFNTMGHHEFLSYLFPDGSDKASPSRRHRSEKQEVDVGFDVDPPDHLVWTLRNVKNNDYTPAVAAEPDAIIIENADTLTLDSVNNVKKKAEAELAKQRRADPILYIRDHDRGLVAVLGQYGKFAEEEAVMERVRAVGFEALVN